MSKELEKSINWLSNVNNFKNVSRYSKEYFEHFNKVVKELKQTQQLLELYRQLDLDLGLVIEQDTTDTWDGPVDYEYLEINSNALDALKTYKKIMELENDK